VHNLDLKSPLLLVIETTNKCNLKCKYCYNELKKVEKTKISYDIFRELIDEASDLDIFDINLSGGEPFLHEDILKFIELIVSRDIGISIVSNGTLINSSIAIELSKLGVIPYIQISFDSHNPEIHNITRGEYDKAFTGFMNLVNNSINKDMSPSVGIVVNKYNFDSVPDTIKFFSQYTSRFHIMNVMKHPELSMSDTQKCAFEEVILPKLKSFVENGSINISILDNKYKELGVTQFDAQKAHIDCLAGFTSLVVASNLEVYPCDVARHHIGKWSGRGTLQDIYNNSKDMWRCRKEPWCIDDKGI
jgi:MoaA/NifB/PqqE/SkfB family radical SAM enzyme